MKLEVNQFAADRVINLMLAACIVREPLSAASPR